MSSGIHARESENAMRDLLKSVTHVVAMDAFANESTLTFLKQYRDKILIYGFSITNTSHVKINL